LPPDSNIYFEDAIWRPTLIKEVYNGADEGFDRMEVKKEELEQLRDLAEIYEEQLYTAMAGDTKGGRKVDDDAFNPDVFDMDEEGGRSSPKGGKSVKMKK